MHLAIAIGVSGTLGMKIVGEIEKTARPATRYKVTLRDFRGNHS